MKHVTNEEEAVRVSQNEQQSKDKHQDEFFDDSYEGQLAVDVFQDHHNNIVITSTVAGVKKEELDISINNDMVTIRGNRKPPYDVQDDQYYFQECFWGGFSRSIILPVDVKADEASAELKNGVLTIKLPKAESVQVKILNVKSDDEE